LMYVGVHRTPRTGLDDARNNVELKGTLLSYHTEGHALLQVARCQRLRALPHLVNVHLNKGTMDKPIVTTDRPVQKAVAEHLVVPHGHVTDGAIVGEQVLGFHL